MKSTAEIHRLSELTIVPTSSKIALIDRGTATGVKNVRVLPIDMPGIFGQSTPFRDLLLGDGAPGQTPPAVTASAPMLQGSSEWYAALNDARERTFPRGKPSAEKEPATPPRVAFKEVGARAVPIMLAEPTSKTEATNGLKVVFRPPNGVSFS
jgi:hypothetical protein